MMEGSRGLIMEFSGHFPDGNVEISSEIRSSVPIERLDIFDGPDLLETVRPYRQEDLGARIRVIWEGVEYRGRFRQVIWDGGCLLAGQRNCFCRSNQFFQSR